MAKGTILRMVFVSSLISSHCIMAAGVQTLPVLPNGAVARAVQVDDSGNLYVVGYTGSNHAFAGKFVAGGIQTLWFKVFAGSTTEVATVLALDAGGFLYTAGLTQSTDFPTTTGAYETTGPAGSTFAVKLDESGNVVYSTYLPVPNCNAIAADNAGHLLLTGILFGGQTFSATPGAVMGVPLPTGPTSSSSYILEVDPTGSKTDLAILGFGGYQIAVDAQGYIYAAGAFAAGALSARF